MTKQFDVAHINEQGQNMIIFTLDSSFGCKTAAQQNQICASLQARANSAGMVGKAVIFWKQGGKVYFIGPRPWHPFLKSLSYDQVVRSINKRLTVNIAA